MPPSIPFRRGFDALLDGSGSNLSGQLTKHSVTISKYSGPNLDRLRWRWRRIGESVAAEGIVDRGDIELVGSKAGSRRLSQPVMSTTLRSRSSTRRRSLASRSISKLSRIDYGSIIGRPSGAVSSYGSVPFSVAGRSVPACEETDLGWSRAGHGFLARSRAASALIGLDPLGTPNGRGECAVCHS